MLFKSGQLVGAVGNHTVLRLGQSPLVSDLGPLLPARDGPHVRLIDD